MIISLFGSASGNIKMNLLQPYNAPSWASNLTGVPKYFIKLAQRDTPIHEWHIPNIPNEFSISVKRDDMTGSVLAGNKVRKLEFVLADALDKGCKAVITRGGIQSNHCRATSIAAKSVGLDCHLLLRTEQPDKDVDNCEANLLLDRMAGAHVYLVPRESLEGGLLTRIGTLADRLWEENEEKAYHIPLGGSSPFATFGYIEAFEEMIRQGILQNFDDIIVAAGSGGTLGGLAISNYLTGSRLRVHGVCVGFNADYFYDQIDEFIKKFELKDVKARDICDVIEGYEGTGYATSTNEELEMLIEISQSTGIVLDPCYTLKAARGMLHEMAKNPSRFKGNRVLFLHTGGFYALFNHQGIANLLKRGEKTRNKNFRVWTDKTQDPLQS